MAYSILGTGSALPARTVTNTEMRALVETTEEWIETRTGICERRVLSGESLTALAAAAAQNALESAGLSAKDLDYILVSTARGDYAFPSLACLVQKEIGALCPALDVNAACSGFLYALDFAHAQIAGRGLKRVLIVCAEAMSRFADWQDRATCVLFGDAAGAVIVGPGNGWQETLLHAQGEDGMLYAHSPAGNSPFAKRVGQEESLYMHMNGQEVFRFAVSSIEKDIKALCGRAGVPLSEISHFVLHQANYRIIKAAADRLKMPIERFPHNIEKYGNTSSASIPLLLDELSRAGRLQKGQQIVLSAFGAGLTTGATLLRWGAL